MPVPGATLPRQVCRQEVVKHQGSGHGAGDARGLQGEEMSSGEARRGLCSPRPCRTCDRGPLPLSTQGDPPHLPL